MANSKQETIQLQRPIDGEWSPNDGAPDSQNGANGNDRADMYRMGRKQQLNRNFRSFSILGLTCVAMGTWLNIILLVVDRLHTPPAC